MEAGSKLSLQWRFACQRRNGTSYLYFLSLQPDDTGSTMMKKLKAEYQRLEKSPPYAFWDRDSILWKPVLFIATISEHSTTDAEAQLDTRCILVKEKTFDAELTAAFHDPELLSDAGNFLQVNSRFEVSSQIWSMQGPNRQAILLGGMLRWSGICILAITGAVICVGVGIGVGFWTGSVDVGIAISSALATILTCVEAFTFWVYR